MQCVLVADDDPHIREAVCFALDQAGYVTLVARDGLEALHQQRTHQPDLIVLDVLMPELDGFSVCERIRESSSVPILMLSSRDEELDRVMGLEKGADDYIGKPFSPRELVARVKANLRRQERPQDDQVTCDGYVLDQSKLEAQWQGQTLALTRTEFRLLFMLASQPDRVHGKDELMHNAYDSKRVVSHRTIDSHIRRLREKLAAIGSPGIKTVHGVGFRLNRL